MPNIGPTELLILLALAAGLIAVTITLVRRGSPAPPPPQRLDPAELQHHLTALIAANKPVAAIKLLRDQTGLDLKSAKRHIDDLRAGRAPRPPLPSHNATATPPPLGHGADLATRVRLLKNAGRDGQAVLLVRGETGMSEPEAQRFVESIQA
ncbi:hypothetical protein FHR32_007925 [Streptosporangium album]|uniref:Ribosomal protein L7/L12 C-terminal domain-containing protein n=1 Tax=Streptosporangium album TaxID=47479 RepID=A0A7W7S421_9ACTN|nr:hypothetical protein [Streptosporangium album]MBB4943525.1 hypothetical protein [Streptosporangium album]